MLTPVTELKSAHANTNINPMKLENQVVASIINQTPITTKMDAKYDEKMAKVLKSLR